MSEENQLNIEAVKAEITNLKSLIALSDDEMKNKLISEIEELFADKEEVKKMRDGYINAIKQLEGALMMVEGLERMADSLGESLKSKT